MAQRPNVKALLGLILLMGAAVRFWALDIKPPHMDEGVNGYFVSNIWRQGFYAYDSTNFHGPLYFYVLHVAEALFGRGIVGFRFANGLISLGIIAGIALHRRFFGRAAIWAALLVAVSPGFVFYSRYAIHESLFILAQVLFSYGFFSWREQKSRLAFGLMVAGFSCAFATKETFMVFFATWAIAVFMVHLADRLLPQRPISATASSSDPSSAVSAESPRAADLLPIALLGGMAIVLLFSGFFMNLGGLGEMLRGLVIWSRTGVGASGHEKPFIYWLQVLWDYEWPALLALVASPLAVIGAPRPARIVIVAGVGSWLAYSLIPYKTPWLVLNFIWPLAFAFGYLLEEGWRVVRPNWLRPALLAVGTLTLVVSTATMLRLNFRDYNKSTERYVYVQTTRSYKAVFDMIAERVRLRPEDRNMKIVALSSDPWPLPWMLSLYPHHYLGKLASANLDEAKVVLIDASSKADLERRLTGRFWVRPFRIRAYAAKGWAYLDFETFKTLVPGGTPVFVGPAARTASLAPATARVIGASVPPSPSGAAPAGSQEGR